MEKKENKKRIIREYKENKNRTWGGKYGII